MKGLKRQTSVLKARANHSTVWMVGWFLLSTQGFKAGAKAGMMVPVCNLSDLGG